MESHLKECLSRHRTMINSCIMAHIDHGKTTFADGLLSVNNIVHRQQVGKLRYMDSRRDEQERGITMKASSILLNLDDILINVIDTPGHVDLVHETAIAASLSYACFILVDLMEGVVAQTRTALLHARRFNLHVILVLNKFDRLFLERNVKQYFDFYLAIEAIIAEANKVYGLETEYTAEEDREKYFDFNKNNVIFGSAVDNWMCSMGHFEKYLLDNGFTFLEESDRRELWSLEEYYVSPKLKSVSREKIKGHPQLAIQILFDTIASLYNLETHSLDIMLKIYRKIMKDNDKVTTDETLLKRFQIREALPRLRKLLLETWMPLGVNSLEIISGKLSTERVPLRNSTIEVIKQENEEVIKGEKLSSNANIIHVAKIFLYKDMLIGFCKNLSSQSLNKATQFYLGASPVSILEYYLMNSTQLIPIEADLIQPRQIFAVKLSSFSSNGVVLPQESYRQLKDNSIRVDSILISESSNQLFKVAPEVAKNSKTVPSFTASPVFKVIFLPKKRFLLIHDEESTAIYNLTFKILTLSDKMLKVVLKPNGFWELFFLGRLHYEKFLVDFSDTMMTVVKYHQESLKVSESDLDRLILNFETLNLIVQEKSGDSSPLLVAFKETISPNFFVFHARGEKVVFEVGGLKICPIFIHEEIKVQDNDKFQFDELDLKRITHQNHWLIQQMEDLHAEEFQNLKIINSLKGNRLWSVNSDLDENLLKYLNIGSKMAFDHGGPLCEEPLTGLDFLVYRNKSVPQEDVDFQFSLAFVEAMKSFFTRINSWFRLVVPLYQGQVLIGSDTTSYQTVCNEVRRFDGKILHTDDTVLVFHLPVTESERFIDQVRKKCHGHVDVHFKFEEEEKTNWKRMDFLDEERWQIFSNDLEKFPIRTKLCEKEKQDQVEDANDEEDNAEDKFEIIDEDDEDDLNDLIELYDNMNKARVRPLVAQMRRHKGLFEEQNYEMFTGEKQEK